MEKIYWNILLADITHVAVLNVNILGSYSLFNLMMNHDDQKCSNFGLLRIGGYLAYLTF